MTLTRKQANVISPDCAQSLLQSEVLFLGKINQVDNFSQMFSVAASELITQLGFQVSQGSAEPEGI